jgi:hypothetical protein
MKRTLLQTACLVTFALMSASAQTSYPAGGTAGANQSTPQSNTKKEVTLRGCVEQTGDEYLLKTRRLKNVELETSEDLKPHVGHLVKVTGSWDREADKSEAAGMGHEEHGEHHEAAEHKGMKEHHFKVSKLEMVADKCGEAPAAK